MNIHGWFPLGLTGWISLQSKKLSRVFSNTTVQKHQFFGAQLSLWSTPPYMTTGKTRALTRQTFVGKVMSLFFNMLSRFVIVFFQGASSFWFHGCSHHLQWFWSPKKIKSVIVSIVSPSICHEVMGLDATIFVFWMLSFKPTFFFFLNFTILY